jgi:hypothetical protein
LHRHEKTGSFTEQVRDGTGRGNEEIRGREHTGKRRFCERREGEQILKNAGDEVNRKHERERERERGIEREGEREPLGGAMAARS